MNRVNVGALRRTVSSLIPTPAHRKLAQQRGVRFVPPHGQVQFGDLRSTKPIAEDWGYSRGLPIDRHYIEQFLAEHRTDIRGRVLEIGDDTYTRQFGGDAVETADVLHIDPDAEATFHGDLADGEFLPTAAFDCVLLVQTLHLIYDFQAALRTIDRILKPGGVLLLTVPGITKIDPEEWGSTWFYSFTVGLLKRAISDTLAFDDLIVRSQGNVLSATCFLQGISSTELSTAELDEVAHDYAVVNSIRVVSAIARDSPPLR